MDIPASPSALSNLPVVLRALMGVVAAGHGLLGRALTLLLYRRLADVCGAMERLAARFAAGRLGAPRRPGVRPAGGPVAAPEVDGGLRPARIWPGRFGWLVRLLGYRAAGHGAQLRTMLEAPEMVALLAAAPQAVRILRPVCRMLAVETSLLRPRAAGGATAAGAAEAEIRPDLADGVRKPARRTREAVEWGRIPLPRGLRAAARRRGFAKGG